MEWLQADLSNLRGRRVVRLDTGLFPVIKEEATLYRRYELDLIELKAGAPKEIMDRADDCDALIVVSSALPALLIERLHRCRIISRRGIGTDKIDVAAATRAGILVTNVPGFCADEMAEHTMALILAVTRKILRTSQLLTVGAWGQARREALRSRRLAGRVLGLIGFGLSAQLVARRAMAFGMRLLATRRHLDAPSAEADELDVRMVDLDTLLAESDYVSLHLPLNAETYHLLDKTKFCKMKPGACLINTARGAIVDEIALVEALREGRLGGAGIDTYEGIDVFSDKESAPDHPLLELDNVVLTPHVAGESVESQQDVATGAIVNLLSVLSGHWPPPNHVVNVGVIPRVPLAEYDASLFEDSHMRQEDHS
jgi:D-3-phosphoglycerate dehydrogenase